MNARWYVATLRNDVTGETHRVCTEAASKREAARVLVQGGHTMIEVRPGTVWDD